MARLLIQSSRRTEVPSTINAIGVLFLLLALHLVIIKKKKKTLAICRVITSLVMLAFRHYSYHARLWAEHFQKDNYVISTHPPPKNPLPPPPATTGGLPAPNPVLRGGR